jgi:hypothetical protein
VPEGNINIVRIIHTITNHDEPRHSRPVSKYGVNSGGNPDVVPAEAGNQYFEDWIPPYQVRGRLVKPGMTNRKTFMSLCIEGRDFESSGSFIA